MLGSLLRICRKRVGSDKLLIGLFNAFARAAPEDFALQQMDPIVAQLIVVFNNSYNKVSKLRKELRVANYTITQLREKSEEETVIKESSLPLPDYPDATAYYNSSTKDQLSQLVTRFGELFIFASNELRDSLDTLPEMEGEDDLQAIFGHETLIVTFNVVKNYIEDRKLAVLKALGSDNNNASESKELAIFETALSAQLHKEFSTTKAGGLIAEELCQEVFKKLKDYPAIDECITVHQFIQKCITISWDIQCCPDHKFHENP
ncbi:hypothetical protein CAEBREN_31291 [Caenorhabditis brenneri]|uniref:Mitochondria-eating protein n=1 Tax=Caenorhabditis brenneri TaxID=135651 RepID=G0P264_CAEBE|nr:hypothetical protein CAEBREN_31291 [Caenorhabditis brenneri]